MAEKMGKVTVLYKYFGPKMGDTMKEFVQETKSLDESEKESLAREAARALGLSQAEVSFSL